MKQFYVYPGEQPFSILANARSTDSLNINDQYNFRVQYITFLESTANALLIQIRVNNTNYFNTEVLMSLIAGNGLQANYYPMHAVFNKSDRIQIDYQNTTGGTITVYTAFIGYEIKSPSDIKKPAIEA